MNEFQGLRAQDFQKAWPQAFEQAVFHVATLHEQAGVQMTKATQQIFIAQRTAEKVSAELLAAKSGIVETIEKASQLHLKVIQQLSHDIANQTADLLARERGFLKSAINERSEIDKSKAQLAAEIKTWKNCPMWRRLWWALYPSSLPFPKIQKPSTPTGAKNG
jgi:hypothetical protein